MRAIIGDEPDASRRPADLRPARLHFASDPRKTGLVQPGTLVRWRYALALPGADGPSADGLLALRDRAKAALPEAGFTVADRRDPSPQVTRTLDRLRQFLTFLGLTALLVGGVGVASAVATFIERRRDVIGTMKSLGATGRLVFSMFLVQVLAIALIGVAIGLIVGWPFRRCWSGCSGMPCRSKPRSPSRCAACSRASPTAFWSRFCSRYGRWGEPNS